MMEDFDTTMSYLANPMGLDFLPQSQYFQPASAGMGLHGPISELDTRSFISGDGVTYGASDHFGRPPLQRFASSYEDFLPESNTPNLDHGTLEQPLSKDTALEHENKLLAFSMPVYNFTLLDSSLRRTSLNLTAHLQGTFFLAEQQWPTNPEAALPPPELTCYRRNLIHISGSITMPRTLRYVLTDQGDRIPILAQELIVSATESVEGNAVKLISVPWKTPAGAAPAAAEDKVDKEPPPIPLDTMGGSEFDADYVVFPIQWKRLQFRIATANNGRRKELQQHFVLLLKIVATLSTGAKISIAEAQSGAIVVRGRSPRNFQSRRDLPLSTGAVSIRKPMGAGVTRSSAGDNIPQAQQPTAVKSPEEAPTVVVQQYEEHQRPLDMPDWNEWAPLPHQNISEPFPSSGHQNLMMSLQRPIYPDSETPEASPSMPLTNHNLSTFNDPFSISSDDERSSPFPDKFRPPLPQPPTSNPPQRVQLIKNWSRCANPTPLSSSPTYQQALPKPRSGLTSPQPPPSSLNQPTSTRPPDTMPYAPHSSFTQGRSTSNNYHHQNDNDDANLSTSNSAHDTAAAAVAATTSNPIEDDSRYEYFPLSLDDWLPPVDGMAYRLHHHHQHHQHQHSCRHEAEHAHYHFHEPPTSERSQMKIPAKRQYSPDLT